MADVNAIERNFPDNTVEPGVNPMPIPPSSAPSADVATDNPRTPGLAPGDETLAALKESVTPAARAFEVEEWMGGSDSATGYEFPPDLNPRYANSGPKTGTAIER